MAMERAVCAVSLLWLLHAAAAHVPILCVPVSGVSLYCGSDTPSSVCVQPSWGEMPESYAGSYLNATDHARRTSREVRAAMCPARPDSVPVPLTAQQYCQWDACEEAADCYTHPSVDDHLMRQCKSYCVECGSTDDECEFRVQHAMGVVADDAADGCTAGVAKTGAPGSSARASSEGAPPSSAAILVGVGVLLVAAIALAVIGAAIALRHRCPHDDGPGRPNQHALAAFVADSEDSAIEHL